MEELQYFLKHGSPHQALRKDEAINHVHWATTRRATVPKLMALAIDHRMQLEAIADKAGAPRERICAIQGAWPLQAAARVAEGRPGFGMLLDENYGRDAMFDSRATLGCGSAARSSCRAHGRCASNSRQDIGSQLVEWPVDPLHQVPVLLSSRRSG